MQRNTKRSRGKKFSLKLQPELVPQPLWGLSACKLLRGLAPWKQIRFAELERAGHRCETCGATSHPLFCHEQWQYDDQKSVATLTAFHLACADCNLVLHMGLAHLRGEFTQALAQLCRVNQIAEESAKQIFANARSIWRKRSRKHWRVGVVPELLQTYPQLKVLVGLDTQRVGPQRELRFRVTGDKIVEMK